VPEALIDELQELRLVDHHVHGALKGDVTDAGFADMITESDRPVPEWMTTFDSPLGFAIRRWCAPVLDLDPFASPGDYLARRRELGTAEVTERFLRQAGVSDFLVETGYAADRVLGPVDMAGWSAARTHEVVRLESVAEQLAADGVGAKEFANRFATALAERCQAAGLARVVGLKTVAAYRFGLDFEPQAPTAGEVTTAAGRWLRGYAKSGRPRLADPVLLRHIIWAGIETELPLQFHVGFGDPDLRLHRADPLLLTRFLELVEPRRVPILLLHCYPFHRHAGYLAQAYPHVYFDVGLAVNYTGARASQIVAESLELAPFAKILYSSDAWGPAELHYTGALLWRRATARVLDSLVEDGEWSRPDAIRVAAMIGRDNARRVYALTD
jgi:predicted TIM-barrel fold metal-dependent hydrolase